MAAVRSVEVAVAAVLMAVELVKARCWARAVVVAAVTQEAAALAAAAPEALAAVERWAVAVVQSGLAGMVEAVVVVLMVEGMMAAEARAARVTGGARAWAAMQRRGLSRSSWAAS